MSWDWSQWGFLENKTRADWRWPDPGEVHLFVSLHFDPQLWPRKLRVWQLWAAGSWRHKPRVVSLSASLSCGWIYRMAFILDSLQGRNIDWSTAGLCDEGHFWVEKMSSKQSQIQFPDATHLFYTTLNSWLWSFNVRATDAAANSEKIQKSKKKNPPTRHTIIKWPWKSAVVSPTCNVWSLDTAGSSSSWFLVHCRSTLQTGPVDECGKEQAFSTSICDVTEYLYQGWLAHII